MFETTLSIDIGRKNYLDYVYNRLKPHIRLTDSVVASSVNTDRCFLSLACEDECREALHGEIVESLCDVYAMGFKYDYLKKKLKINRENLLIKTLLNTMTVFDSNNDKRAIRKELYGQPIIAIDGFFDFRLRAVREKWDEIINLTNENAIVFSDDKISGEFLMFLLDALPQSLDGVKICANGDRAELFDKKGRKIKMIKPVGRSKTEEETILFNLICLAPKKVLIADEKRFSDEFMSIVRQFF